MVDHAPPYEIGAVEALRRKAVRRKEAVAAPEIDPRAPPQSQRSPSQCASSATCARETHGSALDPNRKTEFQHNVVVPREIKRYVENVAKHGVPLGSQWSLW